MEKMGEDKKERWLKISGIVFVIVKLGLRIIPRIIEGVDFIHPERFLIKGVKPEGEAKKKTKHNYNNFFSFYIVHSRQSELLYLSDRVVVFSTQPLLRSSQSLSVNPPQSIGISIPFSPGAFGSQRNRYMEASAGNFLKLQCKT